MIVNYIDPPSGWMYGFPKVLPAGVTNINEWLIENGYPAHLIYELGEHFYIRHWQQEEVDDSDGTP